MVFFALSSIHQLSARRVNKVSHLMVESEFLLPVYILKLVSIFCYVGLTFIRTVARVNIYLPSVWCIADCWGGWAAEKELAVVCSSC